MTGLELTIVFSLALGSWFAMCATMRKLKPSILSVALILLCFAGVVGAFALGTRWNHIDLTCHPGQHCFPWGN